MCAAKETPYGSWRSPITSDLIVAGSIRLSDITVDGDIYWLELHPKEKGRLILVQRKADGSTARLTADGHNVRTRVHEYGGGSYAISEGVCYYSNFADQRLYRLESGKAPQPITTDGACRYADYVVDRNRDLLFCVREDHRGSGEAINSVAKVRCTGDEVGEMIVSGHDFYSSPRLSPDGTRLAWLAWDHPNMPWDGTELWVGEVLADGSLGQIDHIAGGSSESICQPEWSPDGILYFISDRTGWWNLYRHQGDQIEALYGVNADLGLPQWRFGLSTYAFESAEQIVFTISRQGRSHLARLNTRTLALEMIETPFAQIQSLRIAAGQAIFVASSASKPASVVQFDLDSHQHEVLRRSSDITIDPACISSPQAIEFPTEDGLAAHAFYYPPTNQEHQGPANERAPLLVLSHGGPTSATSPTYNLKIQYWTSRGIAVVDVNYGGSTGYGRAYRERLNGRWGIMDVDDCVNAALYLVDRGEADGKRLAIAGGSAGGYTTLAALTFRDVFGAGASHFGVADPARLARDTHKFESRYLDNLIGPLPEAVDLYNERSPIHHVDRLSCPLILFQGLEDAIVPPDQADMMFEAVKAKGIPVAYLPFEGEQHGFRKAENIKRCLDAELYFYSKIFGFEPADPIEPVEIENI